MKNIENIMDQFRPVALRVSRLFFVLIQIMQVDPMYQYSLKFYKMIFERALDNKPIMPIFPGLVDKCNINRDYKQQ